MEKTKMKNGILLLAVFALALGAVQPVLAADYDLLVHNNTEDPVSIKLSGPETYSFTVEPGKIAKTVEEGTYEVSYTACGVEVDTELTVSGEGVWLIIELCPPPEYMAKFIVNSHFGDPLTLSMTGPRDYELSLDLGKNKFIDIVTGDYFYSYSACDGEVSGSVRVTQNGKASLTLYSCERATLLSYGLPNPSNLRMGNYYSFPLNLTLIGPQQYYMQLEPGYNRLDVIRGTYTYLYSAFGQQHSGEFTVTGGGTWVVFSP
jgi:hypothetical protein